MAYYIGVVIFLGWLVPGLNGWGPVSFVMIWSTLLMAKGQSSNHVREQWCPTTIDLHWHMIGLTGTCTTYLLPVLVVIQVNQG